MRVLESPDGGEIVVVRERGARTLDGYEGWTELGTVDRAPGDAEVWDSEAQAFKPDPDLKALRARLACARDPEGLLARIEALENRIAGLAAIETRLNNLEARVLPETVSAPPGKEK